MSGGHVAVGIDTGPKAHAWGAVRYERGVWRYVDSGSLEADLASALPQALTTLALEGAAVAIECPQHAFSAATASPIIATARAAGELAGRLRALGVRAAYTTAADWRRELVGYANAHDAAVKSWLEAQVEGLPARTNVHVRDALGVACWAGVRAERGVW